MTVKDTLRTVAEDAGVSQGMVRMVLDALGRHVATSLKAREDVTVPGLGVLKAHYKPERRGVSPATKQPYVAAAHHAVKLRPDKKLSDAVA